MSSIEKIRKEIQQEISKAGEDISVIHDLIWPSVKKLEKCFRETGNIEALEDQAELLLQMGDNIYRGQYVKDAYVVCKRILEIDSNKEAAKHTIKHHIIPEFKRDYSFLKNSDMPKDQYDELMRRQDNIESDLESYFLECKKDEFALFLDDGANNFNAQGNNVGEK